MDRVIATEIGGHPLRLNDFEWLQNSMQKQGAEICKSFGSNLILMNGLDLTNSSAEIYTWTSGSVFWNDELFLVDSQVDEFDTSNFGWMIVETYDNTYDPTTYKNGEQKNVHAVRRIKLVDKNTFPFDSTGLNGWFANFISFETKRISTKITELLLNDGHINEYGWVNLVNYNNVSGIAFTPQVRRIGRLVEFRGQFAIDTDNWSLDFPSAIYKPLISGNGGGVAFIVGSGGVGNEIHQILAVPFGNGSISGTRLVGTSLNHPKSIDISTLRYYVS